MSNASVEINVSGTSAGAEAAFAKSNALIDNQTAKLGTAVAQSQKLSKQEVAAAKAAAAQRRIQIRVADSLVRKNETLEQAFKRELRALVVARRQQGDANGRYSQTIEDLKTKYRETSMVADEGIDEEIAARAEARAAIDRQVTSAQKLVDKHRDIRVKIDEQKAALKTALDQGNIGIEEHNSTVEKLNEQYKKAGTSQAKSFGSTARKDLTAYATKLISVAAGARTFLEVMRKIREERERGAGQVDSLADTRTSLRQVSNGDFDQLEQNADALATDRTLGITREQARELIFAGRSTGFEGEERTVAAADPVIKIEDGAAFAGEFRKFFSNENLSIETAFNTALAGAAESQFNITQLLPQVRTAAQGNLEGGQSSDVVAAAAVFADSFGQSTGDRLRALQVKLATDGRTKGLDLIPAVRKLLDNPELQTDIVKNSSELKSALSVFAKNFDRIVDTDLRIENAQRALPGQGLLAQAIAEARDETTLSGQIEISRRERIAGAEARDRAAEQGEAVGELSVQASIDRTRAAASSNVGGAAVESAQRAARGLGASSDVTRGIGAAATVLLPAFFQDDSKKQTKEATKQTRELKNQTRELKNQTRALNKTTTTEGV